MKLIFGLLFFTKAQQVDIYNARKTVSDSLLSDDSRAGTSSCGLRGNDVSEQCCNDVDLNCYGCHPTLMAMGIACDKQTIKSTDTIKRDCFCDSSCILFGDCCDDHIDICKHLYGPGTLAGTTTTGGFTTNTFPTTSTTSTTTTTTTTTTTESIPTESWIFKKLFERLDALISAKFGSYDKDVNKMVKKLWHYHHFWVNAEHNCRLDKLPLPGQSDDGSITTYDDIWKGTKQSADGSVSDKLRVLEDGFEQYMDEYFYGAETSKDFQGCDGKKAKTSEYKGIMYKQKRYGRKMLKAIFKISRRKPANQKKLEKEQN